MGARETSSIFEEKLERPKEWETTVLLVYSIILKFEKEGNGRKNSVGFLIR